MMTDLAESTDVKVPVVCPVCNTRSRMPLEAARSAISRHNDRLHDGEDIAGIDPALKDELARLVAKDLEFL